MIRHAEVASALVEAGAGRYVAPPWFADAQRGKALCRPLLALGIDVRPIGGSERRAPLCGEAA